DEALAGCGSEIEVILHTVNSLTVADNGRGNPTGTDEIGKPTTELIFTVLHAGGKFGQGGYQSSGGLHGVRDADVKALSSFVEVTSQRDGERFMQIFTNGGQPASELELIGASKEMGTIIHFKPDPEIFSMTEFKFDTIQERLREAAFLFPDLKITL